MSLLYPLLKPLIFLQDAESAHDTSLELLNTFHYLMPASQVSKSVTIMGLEFPNPVGLAAGLDKNADYLPGLEKLGFGFIEVGTVTPRPQPGNPKPRLFRIVKHNSIINRMGFNNKGVSHLLSNISRIKSRSYILGINIGKNLSTAVEHALDDYTLALRQVYRSADYITINISSPNTPGLRNLQSEKALDQLLSGLMECRKSLQDEHQVYKPIALKISPDLDHQAIEPIADLLVKNNIDALIATNTTLDRSVIANHPLANEAGGLSGEALKDLSRQTLNSFSLVLQGQIPIISAGGIDSAKEAQLRIDLGASLVQIYSALIYQGPGLVKDISKSISV
jgi:dihydroorotate dehydrogenase